MADDPCTCRYLQNAAEEPKNPVVFDEKTNEFHITHLADATGACGYSIVRYCPWCGGAAPASKRGTFFAHITDAESRRLRELTSDLTTVEEAIAKLGTPDEDRPDGLTTKSPASDTEPSVIKSYRVLKYTRLSDTANVTFRDYGPDGGLRMILESKYVGAPKASDA